MSEKLRSAKLLLRATEKSADIEKGKYESLMEAAEDGFNRERIELNKEKENLKLMYEKALQSKEQSRLDTVKQLADLHEIIKNNFFINNVERNAPEKDDSGSDAEKSQGDYEVKSASRGVINLLSCPNGKIWTKLNYFT